MSKPLANRTDAELALALDKLEKLREQTKADIVKFPGTGWEFVNDMLTSDFEAVQDEQMRRRSR